jgi:hypothetical protein
MLPTGYPCQQPTDGLRDASHEKRHGQTDQQDDEGKEQCNAGRTSQ